MKIQCNTLLLTTPDPQINIQIHKIAYNNSILQNKVSRDKRRHLLVHYLHRENPGVDIVFLNSEPIIHRLIPTIGECVDRLASIVECRQTGALGLSAAPSL